VTVVEVMVVIAVAVAAVAVVVVEVDGSVVAAKEGQEAILDLFLASTPRFGPLPFAEKTRTW
jgi:hypothetical protein